MQPRLGIIIASVREGRVGGTVGEWIVEQAKQHGGFDVEPIDLLEVGLPLTTTEPNHPRLATYDNQYTRDWSARITACHAFIFVTPEYNHGYPASLKNALDLVYREWNYKPVGFASYGGVSGGLRSAVQLQQVALTLRMVPVVDEFVAPFVAKQVADGRFLATKEQVEGLDTMLDELAKMAGVLMPLQRRES